MRTERQPGQVSVIIPTYRHATTIVETLDSVFAQTYSPTEIIVVNDGSPDDTAERLRPIAESGRIVYVEQPNTGQAGARNRGIGMARGEFVALLDDDDLWPPDKLAFQVSTLTAHPSVVLVYGYFQNFGQVSGGGRFVRNLSGNIRRASRREAFIGTPGQTLIRADALDQVGGFDPDLWGIDDWDLYIRLAQVGEILYEDHLALLYRVHAGNASKNIPQMYHNALRMRDKHFGKRPHLRDWTDWLAMGRWVRRHYARELQRVIDIQIAGGKVPEARSALKQMVAMDPTFALTLPFWKWLMHRWVLRSSIPTDGGPA